MKTILMSLFLLTSSFLYASEERALTLQPTKNVVFNNAESELEIPLLNGDQYEDYSGTIAQVAGNPEQLYLGYIVLNGAKIKLLAFTHCSALASCSGVQNLKKVGGKHFGTNLIFEFEKDFNTSVYITVRQDLNGDIPEKVYFTEKVNGEYQNTQKLYLNIVE